MAGVGDDDQPSGRNRLGHSLVSSTVLPVPRALDNTDRDYFRAQAEADAGTYVGEVVVSKVGNHRFFVVSQRRPSPAGSFNVLVSGKPADARVDPDTGRVVRETR